MPHRPFRWHCLPFVAALAACTPNPSPPVPVSAPPSMLSRLTGEWAGEYRGLETGRVGSIVFTMIAGENHAHGDVVMVPRGGNARLQPAPFAGIDPARMPQVLSIDFVRASGDSVSGTLTPYLDPDCSCAVSTTFVGRVEANRITGSFRSYRADGAIGTGTWEIRRGS